jgi:multidrug transporter EmrE-like cation transporter
MAIVLMKKAEGTSHKMYLWSGFVCYAATFYLLTMALKYLPMGYTNAIWAGASTFVVYMIGMLYFKEKANTLEWLFVFCILVGIVGLNYLQKGK